MILTLAGLNVLTNSAYSSIAPFFPLEAVTKGVNPAYLGFIFAVYSLTKSLVSPIIGNLMNYFPRKHFILVGLFLEGTAIVAFGLIDFIEDGLAYGIVAGICRIFEGMGNASITTAIYALVTSNYPRDEANIISFL